MTKQIKVDVCVIGGGAAGLVVAAGASQMGSSAVLIEKGRMGGDCLNYGCVPSKSLLAAGRIVQLARTASRFGIELGEPKVDFAKVQAHVQGVIDAIAPNDSVERFVGLGVNVIQETARFTGRNRVSAGEVEVHARRIVIATGSSPLVPPIKGIDSVPYFTNETLFANVTLPEHLVIVGGGPIGIEMAQAHRNLGSRVTVLEMGGFLARDDREVAAILVDRLRGDGIELLAGARVVEVAKVENGIRVTYENRGEIRGEGPGEAKDGTRHNIEGSHLLIAVGRKPSVEELDLETAGVRYSARGIDVDRRLRTSNKKIFAIGDVTGSHQFTHVAGYHAGIAIRNILFRLPAKVKTHAIPWVTYADPELAHVGLTEAQARKDHGKINVLRWPFGENDRAQSAHATDGLVKVITGRKGKILGATMLGPHAGDLIHPWVLAIAGGLKIGAMAGAIVPYPTYSEVSKRAAGSYYIPALTSKRTKRIVRLLARLG